MKYILRDPEDIAAIQGNKYIRYGIGEIEVLTGEDIPPTAPAATVISANDLMRKFTDAEKLLALAKRKTESDIDLFLLDACTLDPIDIASTRAKAAFDAMVANGVLTAARRDAILK